MEYFIYLAYSGLTFCVGLTLGIYNREPSKANGRNFAGSLLMLIISTIAIIGALD